MDEKVKALLDASNKWVGICMNSYHDSRAVPDDLVALCLAISNLEPD